MRNIRRSAGYPFLIRSKKRKNNHVQTTFWFNTRPVGQRRQAVMESRSVDGSGKTISLAITVTRHWIIDGGTRHGKNRRTSPDYQRFKSPSILGSLCV